jgi:hypothetical protein
MVHSGSHCRTRARKRCIDLRTASFERYPCGLLVVYAAEFILIKGPVEWANAAVAAYGMRDML